MVQVKEIEHDDFEGWLKMQIKDLENDDVENLNCKFRKSKMMILNPHSPDQALDKGISQCVVHICVMCGTHQGY